MFHSSLLKPAPNVRSRRPPPVFHDGQLEYVVHRILDSRHVGSCLWYMVSWKGNGAESDSWEPVENSHAPALLRSYDLRFPHKPGPGRH